jgi:methylmalonyl-CoA mutase N-terminal domain/subunit
MEREAKTTSTSSTAWAGWSRRSSRASPQKEIAEASYRFQQAVESRDKIIVGVNDYVQEDEPPIPILYIDETPASGRSRARGAAQDARHGAVRRALDG